MIGEPTDGEAATAEGSMTASAIANVAARNASERKTDQFSTEDRFTARPLEAGQRFGK